MASVLNSKANYYQYSANGTEEAHHLIESEADVFIKEQYLKQRNTNITLEEHLECKKEFQPTSTYEPLTTLAAGTLSYEEFKKLPLNSKDAVSSNEAEKSDVKITKTVSRHVRDLALVVKPNSLETKLLEFAISCNAVGQQAVDNRPPEHPINHLSEINEDLFGHLKYGGDPQKTAKTILRKRKQILESMSEPIGPKPKPIQTNRSLWDVAECSETSTCEKKAKLYLCKNETLYTIRDDKIAKYKDTDVNKNAKKTKTKMRAGAFISIGSSTESSNEIRNRLAENEIKQIPRFSAYERGAPSEILYLKNLSSNVDEEDLNSLFSKYQEPDKPRIVYKLMRGGRMRGQAFVDFHSVSAATKALEEINGTVVHEKPIIIQFSKRKS